MSVVDGEQVVQRFGPFGVSVCEGPYGIFTWQWRNVFVIELSDRFLRGIRKPRRFPFKGGRGGQPFEIPYAAIESARLEPHPFPLSAMKIVSIVYREGPEIREKSIATWVARAESTYAILRRYMPARS